MRTNLGSSVPLAVMATAGLFLGCGGGGSSGESPIAGSGGSSGGDVGSGGSDNPGGGSVSGPPSPCQLVGSEARITEAAGASSTPAIVWTGAGYLVAWSDDRSGSGDIYVASLSPDGVKVAPEIAVVSTPAADRSASLAPSAGGYLVGWSEQGSPGFVIMTRPLAADGSPTGDAATVASSSATEARPLLEAGLGGVAATWIDAAGGVPTAMVGRLSATGQMSRPPEPLKLGAGAQTTFPASAGSATQLGVAYSDGRDGHLNLRMALLDASLAPTVDLLLRDAPNDAQNPSILWDGTRFAVAWEDLRGADEQVYLARVGTDGAAEAALAVPEPDTGGADWPKLATDGNSTVVTFYQFRDGPPQIYLSVLGADGTKQGGDLQVSRGTSGKARFAAIARGATEYGVVWEDTRFGDSEIMFARVSCP
jgi:hypothetical protein